MATFIIVFSEITPFNNNGISDYASSDLFQKSSSISAIVTIADSINR
ncbi:MAG: hypothetical protein PHY05_14045 [Methanothrix sp.]|nr:hypothetical protein [Methanothrix sp.]